MLTVRGFNASPHIVAFNLFGHGNNTDPGSTFLDIDDTPQIDLNPIPALLSVARLSMRYTATFGTNTTWQPAVGGIAAGSPLVVLAGQQGEASDVAFSMTQPLSVGNLSLRRAQVVRSGATVDEARMMASYSLAAPFTNWFVIGSGFSTSTNLGASAGNEDFFQCFGGNDSRIVEGQTQLIWPTTMPGTLQYFLAVGIIRAVTMAPTFRARLRVDGATAIEMVASAIASSPFFLLDSSTTVHLNGGELVNFATHADGPLDIDNSTRMLYAIGFLPD